MPCRNDEYCNSASKEILKGKLDQVTNMLCSVLGELERDFDLNDLSDFNIKLSDKVITWWKEHKVADSRRRKVEAKAEKLKKLRAKALDKLTKEERAALDL